MSLSKQAWPLLYSHLWHQYLAFTAPSSPWSSTCFLAQVATCPQVRLMPTTDQLYILERHRDYHCNQQVCVPCGQQYSYMLSCMRLQFNAECQLLHFLLLREQVYSQVPLLWWVWWLALWWSSWFPLLWRWTRVRLKRLSLRPRGSEWPQL